jgi:predicted transcriptional regulator
MIKNKDVIYQAFFDTKEDKLYYNQLKVITNLSHSSLQTVLKKLKENEEIEEEKTKGNIFYSLTKKYRAIEFTKITYDKINNLNLLLEL